MIRYKLTFFICLFLNVCIASLAQGAEKVSAYLRVKDEIKTIEACLNSIDGVFDRIVIIHSNEKDDGSVAFMQKWCAQRSECEIHEYPFAVIPSHDRQYVRKQVSYENTLAAYNNFGLRLFEPEEWVVKIDADQVYIKKNLINFVQKVRQSVNDNEIYLMEGYNSLPWHGKLVLLKEYPIIGIYRDHFAIKRKNLDDFKQCKFWECYVLKNRLSRIYVPATDILWFHFKKEVKKGILKIPNDNLKEDDVLFFNEAEERLFNNEIRPLLKNSPYYHLKFNKE